MLGCLYIFFSASPQRTFHFFPSVSYMRACLHTCAQARVPLDVILFSLWRHSLIFKTDESGVTPSAVRIFDIRSSISCRVCCVPVLLRDYSNVSSPSIRVEANLLKLGWRHVPQALLNDSENFNVEDSEITQSAFKDFYPRADWAMLFLSRQTGPSHESARKTYGVTVFSKDYVVRVLTGDALGAGTNSNVTIELIGSLRSSGERVLRHRYVCVSV